MRHRRSICVGILTVFFVLAAGRLAPALENWPPIVEAEKVLKDCPQQPGAPAIYLYREELQDDDADITTVYRRLKILTSAGKDYANIEIPFRKGWTRVDGLKARVVRPDGVAREFTGQVFEKTAVRFGGFKMTIQTFALPDVEVGSIIDYRYKIVPDYDWSSANDSEGVLDSMERRWAKPEEGGINTKGEILALPAGSINIQERLFTRRAKFAYTPMVKYIGYIFGPFMRLNWVARNMAEVQPKKVGNRLEFELENILAFETEEFMPPEDAERMAVDFYFCDRRIKTPEEYWKREAKSWQDAAEKFVGSSTDVAAESQKLISGVSDPIAKLKVLYERAQKIQNLSYDKTMTRRRRKELKIKDNRDASDVLKHNYGLRSDITRTFVAMARGAGFQAEVVRVAARDDKLFFKNLLSLYRQLDTELALVNINGIDKLLDPATPFCPLGLTRWSCTGAVFLRPSETPPAFAYTPVFPPDMALTQREIVLQLDLEGNLTGTAKVTFRGLEALVRRIRHVNDDQVEVKKDLETELAAILPAGAKVSLKKVENMANNTDTACADFEISVPGLATAAGQRILLPVSPLLGGGQHPFRHGQRKYRVFFPFPHREFDDIVVTLPPEMKVETTPAARKNAQESFSYSLVCVVENGAKIHVQRDLVVRNSFFPVEQYPSLKAFFDQVRAGDEEQIVLSMTKK